MVWDSNQERFVMIIKRVSPVTGKANKRDIPITSLQLVRWYDGKFDLSKIKEITEDDREFLRSGFTPDCWNELAATQQDGVY